MATAQRPLKDFPQVSQQNDPSSVWCLFYHSANPHRPYRFAFCVSVSHASFFSWFYSANVTLANMVTNIYDHKYHTHAVNWLATLVTSIGLFTRMRYPVPSEVCKSVEYFPTFVTFMWFLFTNCAAYSLTVCAGWNVAECSDYTSHTDAPVWIISCCRRLL